MLDAISAYHDLLGDDQLAADSQAMLTDQLRRHGLVFGGRALCTVLRPRLTNHERHTWLEQRVRLLMRVFAKTYAAAPPRIAVLAHEAVGLAITLSAQADRQPFGPAQLTRAGGFSGIDGAYRLLPDGSTERALAILEVQKFGSGVIEPPSSLSAVPSSPAGATSSVGGVLGGLLPKSILNLN